MTTYEKISTAIQILSTVAIVISLFFIQKQAKAATDQHRLLGGTTAIASYAEFESKLLDISRTLIDFPEIRPYFYEGAELSNSISALERQRIGAFATYCLDYFDHIITLEQQFPGATNWPAQNWDVWMEDMFVSSPVLIAEVTARKHWYKEKLLEISRSASIRVEEFRTQTTPQSPASQRP